MKKLRLLVTAECPRKCSGCCNLDWDLDSLQQIWSMDIVGYDMVMVTGGEPTWGSALGVTIDVLRKIKEHSPKTKKIVYSADAEGLSVLLGINNNNEVVDNLFLDGITFTIHDDQGAYLFDRFNISEKAKDIPLKRLNVFKGVQLPKTTLEGWDVRTNIEWIKNCPLPEDEEFKKLLQFQASEKRIII